MPKTKTAKTGAVQKILVSRAAIARFRAEQAMHKTTGKRMAPQARQNFIRARAEHYFERFPPVSNHRKLFAAKRSKIIQDLARMIKRNGPGVHDKAVRKITGKINKLSFAFVEEDCEGHFYKRGTTDKVNPRTVRDGQKLYFKRASFDIVLSRTKEAMAFKDAIFDVFRKEPFRKNVFLEIGFGQVSFPLFLFFSPQTGKRKREPFTKADIQEVLMQRNKVLKALEAIVDKFAAKKKTKP